MTEEEKRRELQLSEHLCNTIWHWQIYHKPRPSWDHDHCRICGSRIAEAEYGDPAALQAAYKYIYQPQDQETEERYEWVCADCFEELRDTFGWQAEALQLPVKQG